MNNVPRDNKVAQLNLLKAQMIGQPNDLSGQYPILTGHCSLTGRYLEPWFGTC